MNRVLLPRVRRNYTCFPSLEPGTMTMTPMHFGVKLYDGEDSAAVRAISVVRIAVKDRPGPGKLQQLSSSHGVLMLCPLSWKLIERLAPETATFTDWAKSPLTPSCDSDGGALADT